jgi:hypothetical protein
MQTWTKLEPLTPASAGLRSGCLTCGPQPVALNADAVIAVGFGYAGITCDGIEVWCADMNGEEDDKTCGDAEQMAAADPDHDWRIHFHGPLSESEYQRQDGARVLVRKGEGFA